MKTNVQQAPIRNENAIGVSVYSHSGEFSPIYTDLQLTGRGLDFKFMRAYRSSLASHIGELGRGWSSSIAKKIEYEGNDITYHDGAGKVCKFYRENDGNYTSPTGFYGILLQKEQHFFIYQRYGRTYLFEAPDHGGRIVSIEDNNHNAIQFSYSADKIIIVDTLKRRIAISVTRGLLQDLRDQAGRMWQYSYDKDDRLIEVTQPTTADFPNGTSVKYGYDTNHRLSSITDAKGQRYLINSYDKSGKVVAQEHGCGVFKMEYDALGEGTNGFPIYRTSCIRKNGSKILLEHNEVGNVLSRTLHVRKESFALEDTTSISGNDVPLITKSVYNKNSELTSRTFPAGNKTEWVYSEDEKNPLNQGNLSQLTVIPADRVESDQASIVTKYEYEPKFQFRTALINPRGSRTSYEYDEKGNLIFTTYPSVTIQPVNTGIPRPAPLNRIQMDEYKYNSMGQLLRRRHIDGSITEYHYYPAIDPIGMRGLHTAINNPDKFCGYLARVVRDANGKKIKIEYAYDNFGNATVVWDGKSNQTRMRYNAMGKVESVISRESLKNRIDYKYDANYNEIGSAQSFERLEHDETNQTTTVTSSTLREMKEYNVLNNVTLRSIVGDDKIITEYFIRDADENIVRQLQPLGNATEYVYDERRLLIQKTFGVGTRETFFERFTYTLNGAVRTYTDGNGNTTTHHYDGFHRYKGFTSPVGTKKTQWFDEADNVVRVEIHGDHGLPTKKSEVGRRSPVPLMEAKYHFDQWNRAYRVDKVWRNHANEHVLGESKWNGEKGIVSIVLEYAENGLPGKVWTETDNIVSVEYDGMGRVVKTKDLTGEELSCEYDANNNPTLLKHLGPTVEGRRFEQVLRRDYDAMDRLECQQRNDEAPERFAFNELGNVISYVGKSGIEIYYTDDSLGRRVGHAFTTRNALDSTQRQKIVRRLEYDDNYRLSAYTDAAGQRTIYRYDTLDRQTGVVSPDGNAAYIDYDANGNILKIVDQNKNEIKNRYDASNQLMERRSLIKASGKETVEQYKYDGLSRMVGAISPDADIRRTYDSLSRLLTEEQGDRKFQCTHDSAGNLTSLIYPGGEEVHKAYDIRNRVAAVKNKAEETIARFIYRANNQIAKILLGDVIETDFSYNSQERLESIEYRRTDDHTLVEGFRYQYDDTGKMTHEIQLSRGSSYGERYYYDNANRAIKAQYGVQDVFDPNSSFEQETSYEHFQEGLWKRRLDLDGQGQIIADKIGTINQLNRYQHYGDLSFAYDANGNCIRKGKLNPGFCLYTYDQANRLIKSECYAIQGTQTTTPNLVLIQTIEYFYDSFGRQVKKIVIDQTGNRTEYTYVWAGKDLIEEYENGVLVRSYFYGFGSMPVQLSGNKGVYFYTFDGRGLASGLVHWRNPNAFAEKFRYEVPGAAGMLMPPALRSPTNDQNVTSILSEDYLKHSLSGTWSRSGNHFSPEIAVGLSGPNIGYDFNEGHGGAATALGKQIADSLNMLGFGNQSKGTPREQKFHNANSPPPGVALSFHGQNSSLYGAVTSGDVLIKWGKVGTDFGALGMVLAGAALATNPVGWVVLGGTMIAIGNIAWDSYAAANTTNEYVTQNAAAAAAAAAAQKEATAAAAKARADAQDARAEQEERNRTITTSNSSSPGDYPTPDPNTGVAMPNPDDCSGGQGAPITIQTLQQAGAFFTRNKRPVDPNGDFGSQQVEAPSSKGPSKIDLIAHYEDVQSTHVSVNGVMGFNLRLAGGGFTDTRPELGPDPPS